MPEYEMTGTTIVAMKFEGGVIMAADSRTSMGNYVVNRVSNKLTKLAPKIYCCRSGRSSHTQAVAEYVASRTNLIAYTNEREPLVRDAANLIRAVVYYNPMLTASIIVAGYDEEDKGSVYSINLGGSLLKREWAMGGSGSAFLYGYCDSMYRSDMSFEEKFELTKKLVQLAIKRDNMSGGCIRMTVIRREGVENIFIPGNEV
ncbi:20S proteasome, regulatory subunit beta type PSMB6/PSMB9/PRE3 [Trachipleistophora hominis]|uniref:proteasome endopeptidase complex n=1 Tax=Trachipleistophora hominis TaxID=72359 RepID=L7JZD2_TRAHO|nr:20S proteasome, regulatory subunit beta type PSMB6/PSMB9/PRE3 [Trachipleistophora hominis]